MRRIETILVVPQEPRFMWRLNSVFVEIWTLCMKLKHQLPMNFLINDFCIEWIRTRCCGCLDCSHNLFLLIMNAF